MKKIAIKTDFKGVTRTVSVLMLLLIAALLTVTGVFIAHTLAGISNPQSSESESQLHVEGIDMTLLSSLTASLQSRTAADKALPDKMANPFVVQAPPPPPVPPAGTPPPAPQPTPKGVQ